MHMKRSSEADRLVNEYTNGQKNFMTPYVLGCFKSGITVVELTEGIGMNRQPIYGVTVFVDGKLSPRYSCMFESNYEAMQYIKLL